MSDDKVNILPVHPPQEGGGLNSGLQQGSAGIFHATGPQIPDSAQISNLGAPLSREELQKRQEELNK